MRWRTTFPEVVGKQRKVRKRSELRRASGKFLSIASGRALAKR